MLCISYNTKFALERLLEFQTYDSDHLNLNIKHYIYYNVTLMKIDIEVPEVMIEGHI